MNAITKVFRLAQIFRHYTFRKTMLPYPPMRLWVESTNSCNLKCAVCPNSTDTVSPRGNMDMGLYARIIGEMQGKVNDINLSHRGEPLFHPQLEKMILLARHAGIGARIHTNATLLSPIRSRQLLAAGPDLVSFSFDGYDKETYESVRVGGCFETTVRNIEAFLKEKQNRVMSRPYTIIQIIETGDNPPDFRRNLEKFSLRFREWGLDKFYIKSAHNWGGNTVAPAAPAAEYHPCTFPYYSMTILWNGIVTPCPQDWYGQMPLGDANTQTLAEIWNGQPMLDLRKRLQKRDLAGLLCDGCDRVHRKTFLGVPTENFKAFFMETLAGYRLVKKLVRS